MKKNKIQENPKSQDYVLIHVRQVSETGLFLNKVLLVLKNKPALLKGRLNLVGGKVEPGETLLFSAMRELKEETGIVAFPKLCGCIKGVNSAIYCFVADVPLGQPLNPSPEETEEVSWFDLDVINTDARIFPNLKAIVPLLHLEIVDWVVTDVNSSYSDSHEIIVSLDIQKPFINGEVGAA